MIPLLLASRRPDLDQYLCRFVDDEIVVIACFEYMACEALATVVKCATSRLLKCTVEFEFGALPLLLHAFLVPTLNRAGLLSADYNCAALDSAPRQPCMHSVGAAALLDEATITLPGEFVADVVTECCHRGTYAQLVDAVIAAAAASDAFEVVDGVYVRLLRTPRQRPVTAVRETSRSGFAVSVDFVTEDAL